MQLTPDYRRFLKAVLNSERLEIEDLRIIAYNILNTGYQPTKEEWARLNLLRLKGFPSG